MELVLPKVCVCVCVCVCRAGGMVLLCCLFSFFSFLFQEVIEGMVFVGQSVSGM